jgi:hypothetical protein
MRTCLITLILLACCVSHSFGQDAPVRLAVDAAFATVPLEPDPLIQGTLFASVGRGYGAEFSVRVTVLHVLSLGANGGGLEHSDSSPGSELTTGGWKSTSATSAYGSVFAGLRTPPLRTNENTRWPIVVGVDAGRTFATSVKRDIDICIDCGGFLSYGINAGTYLEAYVRFGHFGFGYRIYRNSFDGDHLYKYGAQMVLFKVGTRY